VVASDCQAVSTASTDLSSALAGVTLSADEEATLQSKLQAAADKKLGDLLQVCKLHCDIDTASSALSAAKRGAAAAARLL
jgi:hypothetical protein